MLPCNAVKALLSCLLALHSSMWCAGQAASPFLELEAIVPPLPTEDISGPCHYSIKISPEVKRVRGVWLIFDRGRDVHELASDSDVLGFAQRFDLALILQSHCAGKLPDDHEDMNMEPANGLGPSFFRALEQFGKETQHPELPSADLILLGFSGTGALTGRFVAEYPGRILAGVLSAPGHFPPLGINTVRLNRNAQRVPELIIAGGADDRSGTQAPYDYFLKYRHLGAPWTFVVQNRSPHCCTANVKALMLDWLSVILEKRLPLKPGLPMHSVSDEGGWLGLIHTEQTDIQDASHLTTFNVISAEIRPRGMSDAAASHGASWLPTASVAREWLSFTEQKSHPILPLR